MAVIVTESAIQTLVMAVPVLAFPTNIALVLILAGVMLVSLIRIKIVHDV